MVEIVHFPEDLIFRARENGENIGYLSYSLDGDVLDVLHVVVDESHRGKNIGGLLMEEMYEFVSDSKLNAVMTCSFAKHYDGKRSGRTLSR